MNELDERVGYWQAGHPSHPYAAPAFLPPRASSALSTSSMTSTSTTTTTTTVTSNTSRQPYSEHSPPLTHQQPATTHSPSKSGAGPSSRKALTHALELAQVAVRLDAQNDDPNGAITAYARSVSLLNHVMNSVMNGADDNVRRRPGKRRSSVSARQDEINRLKAIHDTYAERMRILSEIYNIPIVQLTPEEAYNPPERVEFGEGTESIGTAMLNAPAKSPLTASHDPPPLAVNVQRSDPYSISPTTPTPQRYSSTPPPPAQQAGSRLSEVPPARPPPSGPLPSLPGDFVSSTSVTHPLPHHSFVEPDTPPGVPPPWDFTTRPRAATGASIAQSNSGLESLLEEPDTARPPSQPTAQRQQYTSSTFMYSYEENTAVQPQRYSPPLPALPQQQRDSMPPRPSTPHSASQATPRQGDSQRPNSGSSRTRSRSGSVRSDAPPLPVVGNPSGGSISQRRANKPPPLPIMSPPASLGNGVTSATSSSPSSSDHTSSTSAGAIGLGYTNVTASNLRATSALPPLPTHANASVRNRAVSQPGHRPSLAQAVHPFPVDMTQTIPRAPPTPSLANTPGTQVIAGRKSSYTSSMLGAPYGSSPTLTQQSSSISLALAQQQQQLATPCMPTSPSPGPVPNDSLLKPYHLMFALRQSITNKTGAYLTRRLHIPPEVWSAPHVGKLNALSDKISVLEKLARMLDEIGSASANFCGFGAPTADPSRDEIERWMQKLEEWGAVCEDVVLKDGKKLGVGEGFVARKTGGWSNKFARSFEKMTSNGKNNDSSGSYVASLSRLFQGASVLESHTKWFLSSPRGAPYGSVSQDVLKQLDGRLRRSSEFFAKVVLTFVIRDLAILLDKHAKHGEKWLAQ